MKKRILAILSLLVAVTCLSFGLAGCGESSGNGGSTGGSQTEQGGGTEGGTGGSQGEEGGETCAHQFTADNVCSLCGDKWEFTEGLTYELDDETDTYHVINIQKESGDVVVPYGYQGKFVTAVYGWTMEEVQEMMGSSSAGGSDPAEQFFVYSLTGITLPDSVTEIGDYAFMLCQGLKSANLGKDLTSIGYGAFGYSGLTSIIIPDSVTLLGEAAFGVCRELASATIGSGVTSIGGATFTGCNALTSIIIPDNVTSIGVQAFFGCSRLMSIEIPDSVTLIMDDVFCNCSGLTSIIIPDSVTSIGSHAFHGCSGLTSIEIPNSVTSIGVQAFYGCSRLEMVTIGSGVTSIESNAFYNCSGLTSIQFKGTVEEWQKIEKGNNWNADTPDYTVTCSDGTVDKDGNVTYFE